MERTQEITVQLRQDAAAEVAGAGATSPEARDVVEAVAQHGLELVPVDPRAGDPVLESFFRIQAPDEATARELTEALTGLEAVEAAYVKPPDALP